MFASLGVTTVPLGSMEQLTGTRTRTPESGPVPVRPAICTGQSFRSR